MSEDLSTPIELDIKSVQDGKEAQAQALRTFDSYSFERNILVPASPFRFTAPGLDFNTRLSIGSADLCELFVVTPNGNKQQIATGIIDETDTHILPTKQEYVLSGRDILGQLVDNDAVDASNQIVRIENARIDLILTTLIRNTRIPPQIINQQVPNGALLFQTNPGETKINSLQKYLEFTNCLIWTRPNGQCVLGKPNFTQDSISNLILNRTDPSKNNLLEARVRRNVNMAIRQIVTQIQTLEQVSAAPYTLYNQDPDMLDVAKGGGGRSVYRKFDYGQGTDTINQIVTAGNSTGNPTTMGVSYSLREIARENMKILDVECVVKDHVNAAGNIYDIDQIYNVQIEDEALADDLYIYSVSYELTPEHGRLTRLKLCNLGTMTAYSDALRRLNKTIGVTR